MKNPITGMSRFEISQIKTRPYHELEEKREYYRKLAMRWNLMPNSDSRTFQQANKYFDAVSRYEREIERRDRINESLKSV